jgi:hypothetical protein
MYASDEDYSWLEERFGLTGSAALHSDSLVPECIAQYRQALPETEAIASTLAEHLLARIADLRGALESLVEETRHFTSPEQVVRESQYYAAARDAGDVAYRPPPPDYDPPYRLSVLDELEARAAEITSAPSSLAAFGVYSELEVSLEGLERPVYAVVAEVDRAIQLAIDIARGK